MSRRVHAPNTGKDVVMGPPPVPQSSDPRQAKEEVLATEKYRRLKRKYNELDERYKEIANQVEQASARYAKMGAERDYLLARIAELEKGEAQQNLGPEQPSSTAYPRALISDKAQFIANLRQARDEVEREDHSIDPVLTSRHAGPAGRKRREQQYARERMQEDTITARDVKPTRRSRPSTKAKDKEPPVPSFTPAPASAPQPGSGSGLKLRIKPPAPPPQEPAHVSPPQSYASQPQPPYVPPPSGPGMSPHSPTHFRAGSDGYPSPVILGEDNKTRAKPKRLKAHTVTSKTHNIPTIPRDPDGRPLLPLNVGIMTVISLGEVCMREHFHTERYIFPVGYSVTRRYLSTVNPNTEVAYTCTIIDGGDGPQFSVVASDVPDKPIIAGTATGAWSVIVRAANHVRNRAHSNSVSGPDFFGLGQNTIKHLIQELPGADRLKDYVWQTFTEGT